MEPKKPSQTSCSSPFQNLPLSSSSSASFENGANAAPSGNLRLTVADSNEDTTNALAQVANAVSAEAVNLTLDQIVSKGNGNSWETPVTQFSQPVKMKLKIKQNSKINNII